MVATYLVLSYAYYIQDVSLVSDDDFDALCKELNKDSIWEQKDTQTHPHVGHVDRGALEAGSGYQLRNLPTMVITSAHQLINSQ